MLSNSTNQSIVKASDVRFIYASLLLGKVLLIQNLYSNFSCYEITLIAADAKLNSPYEISLDL